MLVLVYLCNRGDTKRSLKQYAEAAADYVLAIAADPLYARAHNALGNANVNTIPPILIHFVKAALYFIFQKYT